jgi:hypothetical protein
VLEATAGRPYAFYVHGSSDTVGAVRGVETITTGLKWKRLRDPLIVFGEADADAREACWELGAMRRQPDGVIDRSRPNQVRVNRSPARTSRRGPRWMSYPQS